MIKAKIIMITLVITMKKITMITMKKIMIKKMIILKISYQMKKKQITHNLLFFISYDKIISVRKL